VQAVTLPVAWERVVQLDVGQRPTDAPTLRLFLEVAPRHPRKCSVACSLDLCGCSAGCKFDGVSVSIAYRTDRCRSWGGTRTSCWRMVPAAPSWQQATR
jgi:hypothetical protein